MVLNATSANAKSPRAKRHSQVGTEAIGSEEDLAAGQSWEARKGDQSHSGSFPGAGQTCQIPVLGGARAHASGFHEEVVLSPSLHLYLLCGILKQRREETKEERAREERTRKERVVKGGCGGIWE